MPILTPHHATSPRAGTAVAVGAALLAVLGGALAGCRGDRTGKPPRQFIPDMDEQPRWNPQEGSEFFADGRIVRLPDPRTVAFGAAAYDPRMLAGTDWGLRYLAQRERSVGEDDAFYRGLGDDAQPLSYAPLDPTPALIARGQERFDIYCSACHGYIADGKGMVGVRWSYPPANLVGAPYTDRNDPKGKDGHFFNVIRNGVWAEDGSNRMPAYGHAVDESDAWAIVFYLRALQRAQNGTLDDLPPGDRQRLESVRGPAPAPAPSTQPQPEGGA